MSESFDVADTEVFTAGSEGPPGERVFYLQVRSPARLLSFKCEKAQVAALGEHLTRLLHDLPPVDDDVEPGDEHALSAPVVPQWTVGTIGMTYDEDTDRVLVLLEELVPEDEEGLQEREPAEARILLTREQATAFARHAPRAVAGGRPQCRLCGRPMDPEGHACPRTNGHRR